MTGTVSAWQLMLAFPQITDEDLTSFRFARRGFGCPTARLHGENAGWQRRELYAKQLA